MKCPFCGNTHEDEFAVHTEIRDVDKAWAHRVFNIACSCGAQGPDADTEAQAVYLFTHRPDGSVRND